jgi:hypothetical protein
LRQSKTIPVLFPFPKHTAIQSIPLQLPFLYCGGWKDLLSPPGYSSVNLVALSLGIYNYLTLKAVQSGDPSKLAQALVTLSEMEKPPLRFIAGADAIDTAEKVVALLQSQINAHRELSTSLAYAGAKL